MVRSFFAHLTEDLPLWLARLIDCVGAVALLVVIHFLLFAFLRRLTRNSESESDNRVVTALSGPTLWLAMLAAVAVTRRGWALSESASQGWQVMEGILLSALLGWLGIALLRAARDIVNMRSDISQADNLNARRRRTRMAIFTRIGMFIIVFISLSFMLLMIPGVRNIGVSLLASAGLAGLAVGAAAQPALKNLIAGIQMAFTEPIRIDDAIVIAGEWGWVEEIRLTYVVVKVWDERRLIVPVAKFLEEPFQNWTFRNADLLGSVFLYLDPATDVGRLRGHFEAIIGDEPLWDGRGKVMQVTDSKPDSLEIRILATARNSPEAFDLRCSIREKMFDFVRREMPEALPRTRALLERPRERHAAG